MNISEHARVAFFWINSWASMVILLVNNSCIAFMVLCFHGSQGMGTQGNGSKGLKSKSTFPMSKPQIRDFNCSFSRVGFP